MATNLMEGERGLVKGGKPREREKGTSAGQVLSVKHFFEAMGAGSATSLGTSRKENSSCYFCICVLDRFRMKQLAYKSSIPIMPKGLFETGACLIVTRSLLNY